MAPIDDSDAKKVAAELKKAGMFRKVGRPSKYSKAMCDDIIEAPSKGIITIKSWCWTQGIEYETAKEWSRRYPEFSSAVKKFKQGVENLMTSIAVRQSTGQIKGGAQATLIFMLKNTCNWRDKIETVDEEIDDFEM